MGGVGAWGGVGRGWGGCGEVGCGGGWAGGGARGREWAGGGIVGGGGRYDSSGRQKVRRCYLPPLRSRTRMSPTVAANARRRGYIMHMPRRRARWWTYDARDADALRRHAAPRAQNAMLARGRLRARHANGHLCVGSEPGGSRPRVRPPTATEAKRVATPRHHMVRARGWMKSLHTILLCVKIATVP